MRILITGCCGFVGMRLLEYFCTHFGNSLEIYGIDNLSRPGSESNRSLANKYCQRFYHGDLRLPSDLEGLPHVDWVVDASANASVLSGIANSTSSRQLVESNLVSTINVLEYCKARRAGLILLSSSRVYSIDAIRGLLLVIQGDQFTLDRRADLPSGCSHDGITEQFSTSPPLSLYGTSKLAAELLAMEYSQAFGFPLWVNRCGLLAGAGQLGRADQGIVAYWIHSWLAKRSLRYIGFGGQGFQVRDCLHPHDLAELICKQIASSARNSRCIFNVSGGVDNQFSLAQLSHWCREQFGENQVVATSEERHSDLAWLVLDSRCAQQTFDWVPKFQLTDIFAEVAAHARKNPNWLTRSDTEY